MAHAKYIPTSDSEKGVWLTNFTSKLGVYAATLGVTPTELSSVQNDQAMFKYIINLMEQYYNTYLSLAGYKNMLKFAEGFQHLGALPTLPTLTNAPALVPEGIFERVSRLVKRMKASPNYNDHIGTDLGIVAPHTSVDVTTMQPKLTITLNVGKPHIKWVKGRADAVDLFVNKNDDANFILIGRFTRNEYIDVAEIADNKRFDEWHYKAIYVIADNRVGLFSNVTSIAVKKI